MRSEVYSVALSGLTATIVKITVTLEPGEPSLRFVGVDDLEVRHLLNVWASALGRARRQIEDNRIVVEFSPPVGREIDKLTLALFVALHLASENRSLPDTLVLGDILPSGWLRPVCGALPALLGIRGMARAIVPEENGPETACVPGMEVFAAETLLDVLEFVGGERTLPSAGSVPRTHWPRYDMVDLRLLHEGSRAAEIVAAGLHHVMFLGSPGCGTTSLSCRLPAILPELTPGEALEATSLHSASGFLLEDHFGVLTESPFRLAVPGMHAKRLFGGRYPMRCDAGATPVRPGEVSLAHHGVLLVDDLQSWKADTLAAVDRVLAEGQAVLEGGISYPARPLLVLDALPCRCGYYRRIDRKCKCTPAELRRYRAALHGPMLDRVDLRVYWTGRVPTGPAKRSAVIRARVLRAREAQRHRCDRNEVSAPVNGQLTAADLERVAAPDDEGRRMLDWPALAPELRAKVLRVARTIADLDGSDAVRAHHIAEALQFAPRPET